MRPLFLALALVAAFGIGLAARGFSPSIREIESLRESTRRLELEVSTLQEQLRVSQAKRASRPGPLTGYASAVQKPEAVEIRPDRPQAPLPAVDRTVSGRPSRRGSAPQGEPQDDLTAHGRVNKGKTVPAPTVEAAMERFNRYLEEMKAAGWQVRWPRLREVASDLQAMGDAGAQALLRSLTGGATSDERRAAAQLVGELQMAQALPYLQGIPPRRRCRRSWRIRTKTASSA